MDPVALAKWLVAAGILLVMIGAAVWILARSGLPFGALPGDLKIETRRFLFSVPLATCAVISIVLTVVLNLLWLIFKR